LLRRLAGPSLAVLLVSLLCAGVAAVRRDGAAALAERAGAGLKMEAFAGEAEVIGSGGERSSLIPSSIDLARLAYAVTHGVSLQDFASRLLGASAWTPFGPPLEAAWGSYANQAEATPTLVSDGQFVWGPNAENFDVEAYLQTRGSDLVNYADDIILWSDYSSVNPQVLLAVLETRDGMVDGSLAGMTADDVRARIEDTSIALAKAFYEHLYLWGARRPPGAQAPSSEPLIELGDGAVAQVSPSTSSGSYAVASVLAVQNDLSTWQQQIAPQASIGFAATFGGLFPGVDPLDEANAIDPPAAPPADLLQFPFPLGAVWYFGGPHSWNGDSTPPFSSMDFFAGGGTCAPGDLDPAKRPHGDDRLSDLRRRLRHRTSRAL
jgi:hypothetical protein